MRLYRHRDGRLVELKVDENGVSRLSVNGWPGVRLTSEELYWLVTGAGPAALAQAHGPRGEPDGRPEGRDTTSPPATSVADLGVVSIAYCPEHGLHGSREECFVCGGPVQQIQMHLPGGTEDNDLWAQQARDGSGVACIASVWEPTDDERAAIFAGANIVLVIGGEQHPPVALTTTTVQLGRAPEEAA